LIVRSGGENKYKLGENYTVWQNKYIVVARLVIEFWITAEMIDFILPSDFLSE